MQPGTGHLLAMSVNRIFGYDLTDPAQESFNLNAAPSRGAGSTYKVFVAAAALARGYSSSYTLTAPSPYYSRVYKKDGGPYPVRNATTGYKATLDLTTALYQSSNTYFLALEDALGSVEEPVRMAEAMGLYKFGPDGLAQTVIDENRGSFTFGPDATSPLGTGQRLLHARRQRHAVRRRPGDRASWTASASRRAARTANRWPSGPPARPRPSRRVSRTR